MKSYIDELRVVTDFGFYSWDIPAPNLNVQDDAIMYGLKLTLKHKNISWENTFSGYNGWILRVEDYGDSISKLLTELYYSAVSARNTVLPL